MWWSDEDSGSSPQERVPKKWSSYNNHVSFYLGGHLGNDGNIILLPRMCEQSAYADPKPTPAPNAIADDRVVRPLNIRMAVANPVKEPYTNRRSVKSMHKSYCSSIWDCGCARFFAMSLLMSLKLFGPVGALHSSDQSTDIIKTFLRVFLPIVGRTEYKLVLSRQSYSSDNPGLFPL